MTRYYVKQGPYDQIEGPYNIDQLRYRVATGMFGADAVAVAAIGQTLNQLRGFRDWTAVDAVMAAHPAEDSPTSPSIAAGQPWTPAQKQRAVMWALLAGGLLLVMFTGPLAQTLVPKESFGNGSMWSPEAERDTALAIRLIGIMLFAAGLVERALLALTPRTSADE